MLTSNNLTLLNWSAVGNKQAAMKSYEELEKGIYGDWDTDVKTPEIIITRDIWEPREPSQPLPRLKLPVYTVIVGYTKTGPCENNFTCIFGAKRLQRFYMDTLKLPDQPYSFLVGGHGSIFEGRGWDYQPLLPQKLKHHEETCIYIGFFGDVDTGYTHAMSDARDKIIRTGMEKGHIGKKILSYFVNVAIT